MKLPIYPIVFLIISSLAYSAGDNFLAAENLQDAFLQDAFNPNRCSTAKFCGDFTINCEAYRRDDICPENYGDWGSCDNNNYGKKCIPCDPDCGGCGQRIDIDVPNVQYPGGYININVNAYDYSGSNRFILSKVVGGDGQTEP